jgi:signal transduction histidine kinase
LISEGGTSSGGNSSGDANTSARSEQYMHESIGTDRIYAMVAAIAAGFGVLEAVPRWWEAVLLGVALVPWALLVTGRDAPLQVFSAIAVIPVACVVAISDVGSAVFVSTAAASRVASRTGNRRLVVGVALAVVAIPFLPLLTGHPASAGSAYFAFGDLFGVLVGVLLRRATGLAAELQEAQARLSEVAGAQERQRIARDVHDLVAHSLTIVVLHVGGARRVLRSEPEIAERALEDAERVCRESLDGIRGVVGLLRDPAETPVVSLDLTRLFATYRAAGIRVTAHVAKLDDVPLALRVTLYRVIQEALANAARHGGKDTIATVNVQRQDGTLMARITNTVAPQDTSVHEVSLGGYGLTGLGEQVSARGGAMTSGKHENGWAVACMLPLAVTPTAL